MLKRMKSVETVVDYSLGFYLTNSYYVTFIHFSALLTVLSQSKIMANAGCMENATEIKEEVNP